MKVCQLRSAEKHQMESFEVGSALLFPKLVVYLKFWIALFLPFELLLQILVFLFPVVCNFLNEIVR